MSVSPYSTLLLLRFHVLANDEVVGLGFKANPNDFPGDNSVPSPL
jgi:hypothetical protein